MYQCFRTRTSLTRALTVENYSNEYAHSKFQTNTTLIVALRVGAKWAHPLSLNRRSQLQLLQLRPWLRDKVNPQLVGTYKLFLLYINDIVNDIGSNIGLFADDTSLFLVAENPDTAAETLNSGLEKITQRANTWLFKV